jgi:hypothetical protein
VMSLVERIVDGQLNVMSLVERIVDGQNFVVPAYACTLLLWKEFRQSRSNS